LKIKGNGMLLAIKIFHFIGLALLLGGGVCNGVVLGKAGTSDDAAKSALRSASRRLGQITFIGLIILWGTGIYMVSNSYGGWTEFPTLFWGKMVAVVLLSVAALAAQMYSIVAIFSGSRTPREKVIRLTAITTLLTLIALSLAVWAFDGGHVEPTADMPAEVPEAAPAEMPADEPTEEPAEPLSEQPSEPAEEPPST
jgi:hypothetical protein